MDRILRLIQEASPPNLMLKARMARIPRATDKSRRTVVTREEVARQRAALREEKACADLLDAL